MLKHITTTLAAAALVFVSGCMMPPGAPNPNGQHFLVYFDEFSANLTPEALKVIADAAAAFKHRAARAVRIEARASATGSPEANKALAQTRTQVVADELAKDGVSRLAVRQVPIGQTGSGDDSVAERRVDIIVEP